MTACARGCTMWKRHIHDGPVDKRCPVEDRKDGAWRPLPQDDPRRQDVTDTTTDDELRTLGLTRNRWGGLEEWHACHGCKPREATHGALCEHCHLRLVDALKGGMTSYTPRVGTPAWWERAHLRVTTWTPHGGALAWHVDPIPTWQPSPGSLAWAHDWLAADREPNQASAGTDKIHASRTPPAALALHVYDLRQDIAAALGKWLAMVCNEFHLTGPAWWRYRVQTAGRRGDHDWRAWLPQSQAEVVEAQRFVHAWLPRIEAVPDLVTVIYAAALVTSSDDPAAGLLPRVAALAPWRAKPRKLRGVPCPECERDALAIYEGSDNVTCRRCKAVFTRERYDIWTEMLASEPASSERIAS